MPAPATVIVGASAAGLKCACRLRRLEPDRPILVVEARRVFSYGACGLPYVLSGDIEELAALRRTPFGLDRDEDYFAGSKNVEVLSGWSAVGADPNDRRLRLESVEGDRREVEWGDLVLATGARPRRLPGQPDHPRVVEFHVWEDVAPLKRALMRGEIEHVAIVGAGLVGSELAEAFRALWGAEVTLVEAAPWPLPMVLDRDLGLALAGQLAAQGVRLELGRPVTGFEADDDGVRVALGGAVVEADVVVVAIGVAPQTDLAEALGVRKGPTGAISVDETMATTVPGVWSAGDCVECRHVVTGQAIHLPLGSLANRQGRVVADRLAGRQSVFPAVAGAVAVKVFDWNVAAVGCTAAHLGRLGRETRSVWVAAEDAAHYWPEARELLLTLVYDPRDRRLLGLQVAGKGEAVKRVDLATQLIVHGATLEDLASLEHAYAPPYAPALDPLAVLAFAALNQEDGVPCLPPTTGLGDLPLVDLRLDEEREELPTDEESLALPVHQLESRLDELPDGPSRLICARGTRSSEIVRRLRQRGREVSYLGGGMAWRRHLGGR